MFISNNRTSFQLSWKERKETSKRQSVLKYCENDCRSATSPVVFFLFLKKTELITDIKAVIVLETTFSNCNNFWFHKLGNIEDRAFCISNKRLESCYSWNAQEKCVYILNLSYCHLSCSVLLIPWGSYPQQKRQNQAHWKEAAQSLIKWVT